MTEDAKGKAKATPKARTKASQSGECGTKSKTRRKGLKLQNGCIVSPFGDFETFDRVMQVLHPQGMSDYSKWGDPLSEDGRAKAMKYFQRVVNWYNCASFEYAYGSPEIRAQRPRMVTLARILSATIAAHVADDMTTLAALEEVATPFLKSIGSDPALGFQESFCSAIYGNPKDRMLDRMQGILCKAKGNEDGLDPKEYAAREIAFNMFANHGFLFIDELPSDIDTSDKATLRIAERGIKRALRGKDVDTWEKNSRDIAENLIRAALYELGCKNARGFFDYLGKRAKPKEASAE